jgi:CBS domain containing-hemolysin-like protein
LLPVTLPFRLLTFKPFNYNLRASSYNRHTINLLAESGIELGNIYHHQERLIRHILNLSNITLDSIMEPIHKRGLLTSGLDRKRVIQSINRNVQGPYFVLLGKQIVGTISLFDIWKMPPRAPVKNYMTPITYLSPRHTALHALEYMLAAKKQSVIIGSGNRFEGFVSIGKLLGKGLSL